MFPGVDSYRSHQSNDTCMRARVPRRSTNRFTEISKIGRGPETHPDLVVQNVDFQGVIYDSPHIKMESAEITTFLDAVQRTRENVL